MYVILYILLTTHHFQHANSNINIMNIQNIVPITRARKEIFSITDAVQEKNTVYILTEHGKPKVVILSPHRYSQYTSPLPWMVQDAPDEQYCASPPSRFRREQKSILHDSLLSTEDRRGRVSETQNAKELAKAQLYVILIQKYHYPARVVLLDQYVRIGNYQSNRYIEADIIVTHRDGNPKIICITAPFQKYKTLKMQSIKELFDIAQTCLRDYRCASPHYLLYYSHDIGKKKNKEHCMLINFDTCQTFAAWKKVGMPHETSIPPSLSSVS